ncbi:MAG: TadE/TadG family type IV pilus assembly protein [Burkholderiaceae bacterium]
MSHRYFLSRLRSIARMAARLHGNDRGVVAPLFMVTAVLTIGISLGAFDLIRYAIVKERLQNALDSAALAAGQRAVSGANDSAVTQDALAFFSANFPPAYLGSSITGNQPVVQLPAQTSDGSLQLSATGTLPLISTGFLKTTSLDLVAQSKVLAAGNSDLQIVMALDVNSYTSPATGSALQTAAAQITQALLNDTGNSGAYVGVVPFAETVHVGSQGLPWVQQWTTLGSAAQTRLTPNNYLQTIWDGCIAEPASWNGPPATASPLSPNAQFQPLFVRAQTRTLREKLTGQFSGDLQLQGLQNREWVNISLSNSQQPIAITGLNNALPSRGLWADFGTTATGGGNLTGEAFFMVYGALPFRHCQPNTQLEFLRGQRSTVNNVLNRTANAGITDHTLLPAGLLWSWRMLHPTWRGGNGWSTQHLPDSVADAPRAIVLVSQSANAGWSQLSQSTGPTAAPPWTTPFSFSLTYSAQRCAKGNNCPNPLTFSRIHDQTGSPATTQGWQYPVSSLTMANPYQTGDVLDTTGWTDIDTYTLQLCNAIKAQDITIYVLHAQGSNVPPVLDACASGPVTSKHIYDTTQVSTLLTRLQALRSGDSELRLVP